MDPLTKKCTNLIKTVHVPAPLLHSEVPVEKISTEEKNFKSKNGRLLGCSTV
jgi:hypothetical protein